MTFYTTKDIEVVSYHLINDFIELLGDDYDIQIKYKFSSVGDTVGHICIILGYDDYVKRRYYTVKKTSVVPNFTFVGKLIENTFLRNAAFKKNYGAALKQELVGRYGARTWRMS